MSNYYASTRSNYFRVKDEEAFKKWADHLDLTIFRSVSSPGMVGIHANNGDCNGWPNFDYTDDVEIDIAEDLSKHLEDGQVAVLMETGAEKLRYLVGCATAVHSSGRLVQVHLGQIYEKALEAFPGATITEAEW